MGGPGSGGARPNSGPKKVGAKTARQYGDAFRRQLSETIKRKAQETGKSLQDVLVDMVYDESAMLTARVGALKQVIDVLVPKESHKTVEETKRVLGPVILPERRPDPAKEEDAPRH